MSRLRSDVVIALVALLRRSGRRDLTNWSKCNCLCLTVHGDGPPFERGHTMHLDATTFEISRAVDLVRMQRRKVPKPIKALRR